MISATLHFIIFISLLGLSGILFYRYLLSKYKSNQILSFSFAMISLAVYNFLLAFPLFTNNLISLAISYNIAITFFFIVLLLILNVALQMMNINRYTVSFFLSSLATIGISSLFLQFYQLRLPIVYNGKFIFWNADPIAEWTTSLAGFIVALVWAFVIIKNVKHMRNSFQKIKSTFLASSAILIGLASLIYFHSSVVSIISAFVFLLMGVLSLLISISLKYFLPSKQLKKSKK